MLARIRDAGGYPEWCRIIEKVPRSRYLTGKTKERFMAHFNFVLQESSFTKLREGVYDDPEQAAPKFTPLQMRWDLRNHFDRQAVLADRLGKTGVSNDAAGSNAGLADGLWKSRVGDELALRSW